MVVELHWDTLDSAVAAVVVVAAAEKLETVVGKEESAREP